MRPSVEPAADRRLALVKQSVLLDLQPGPEVDPVRGVRVRWLTGLVQREATTEQTYCVPACISLTRRVDPWSTPNRSRDIASPLSFSHSSKS
jgi:hypothetical protein